MIMSPLECKAHMAECPRVMEDYPLQKMDPHGDNTWSFASTHIVHLNKLAMIIDHENPPHPIFVKFEISSKRFC